MPLECPSFTVERMSKRGWGLRSCMDLITPLSRAGLIIEMKSDLLHADIGMDIHHVGYTHHKM
jgi:hypothetical protein